MKIKQIVILFLLIFKTAQLFSSDTLTEINYELIKSSDKTVLKLTIIINDTSKVKQKETNTPSPISPFRPRSRVNFDDCEKHICSQIMDNPSLEILIKRPDYINEIINLIPNQQDKEKALEIFDDNILGNVISSRSSQNSSEINGKCIKEIKVELSVPLVIKSSTTLILKSMKLEYENNIYWTKKVEIKIEK